MTFPAIHLDSVGVRYRPYVDSKPTLRRGLRRAQREIVALDDISFDVMPGESFGVIGHNGAGKSTLLKVIARTLTPTTGKVVVRGNTSTLLSLGVGFKSNLSGSRNIYLGAMAQGMTRARVDEIYDDIVEYAELEDAIDLPVNSYSSGMFGRLAFAIAMHIDPEILLLDEVLAVGDASFKAKSTESMVKLLENSGTIVLVSHSMSRVVENCRRVAWIDEGTVREIGPSEEVVERYTGYMNERRRARDAAKQ